MSDLYLVLRTRLPVVGKRFDWVNVGSDVLAQAMKTKGLGYESTGRLVNLSGKMVERYVKTGQVPRHELSRLAEVLDLEVEQAEPARITLRPEDESLARSVDRRLRRIEEALGIPPRDEVERPGREAANGS